MHCESTLAAFFGRQMPWRSDGIASLPRHHSTHGCLACSNIVVSSCWVDRWLRHSVGNEHDPSEFLAAREKMEAQKLGIVFKTTNKVRATELVCYRNLNAGNAVGVALIV